MDTAQMQQAAITFASSGDNNVVAGVAGQVVRVYKLWI